MAILNPLYDMAPFTSGVKYNIGQMIFVLTDNDEGLIYEYSESCKTLLKLNQKFEYDDGAMKKIGDFIVDLNFNEFKKGR